MEHNPNFFNQHCLSLTRFAVILLIGVMFTCSDDNEAPLDPPAVPTGFSVLSVSDDRVVLTWDEMEDVTHYGLFQNDLELDRNILDPHYTATNLDAITPYFFSLQACNEGGCSPQTRLALVTAPVTPESLSVEEVTSTTILLSWLASRGATHYVIDTGSIQITNDGADFYEVTNLQAATSYVFKVRACNDYGCSPEVDIDIITAPSAPVNFTHGTVTSTNVELKWQGVTGAGFYIVYRGGKAIMTNRSGNRDATTHKVVGLTSNTEEVFGLEACNNSGCSSRATLTLTTAPDAPEGLVVGEVTSYTISLSWGRSLGATHYVIDTDSIQITNQGGENTSSTIPGLEGATPYTLRVRACNGYGCSSEASVKATTALATPKNFTAKNITSAGVTLEWDAVTGAGEYIIYREKTPIATNTALTHTVVNLRFSTSYNFFVRACNSQSCSDLVLKQVTTLEAPDSFSIAYPDMESATPDSSRPVFVSSESCNILDYTLRGKARYSIFALTDGSRVVPTIDPITGVVNNKGASPGAYKVTVTIPENVDCNTDVLVYNTITPANRSELGVAVDSGIGFHGNTGNFNYIITSQITDMSELFERKDSFNGDITEWDTANVIDMDNMFRGSWNNSSVFNQPIGNWDTSQVRDMSGMFWNAYNFNQPLSNWDTSKVENMYRMFSDATNFNQPLSNWDTSKVENMGYMFYKAHVFDQPIGSWDTSKVENMHVMFSGASKFNQPLSNWDTSKVRSMTDMFYKANAFDQPLSNWDTSKVQYMNRMFFGARAFDQDLSGWVVTNIRQHYDMFEGSAMEDKTEQHPKWPTDD